MLKGERVILRGIRRDDLPRLCEFNNDADVERAGGGDPPFPQSLERLQAEWDKAAGEGGRDGAHFAMEAEGKFIGQCALFGMDECKGVNRNAALGIGIGDKAYWGKGYGREAVGLLLDYAFRDLNLHRVWLTTHGANERAIRCYRACGFVEEGRLREHLWTANGYVDQVQMGILRAEWEAARGR
jgi:RimJ/RimL family protein N-acetyltransferase